MLSRACRWLACAVLLLGGCGGGSHGGGPLGPTGPGSTPTPTPPPGETVEAVLFYDEDGDGVLRDDELTRVPDVEVTVAGRTGRSAVSTGRVRITGVPAGTHRLEFDTSTLPPFYQAPGGATITAPQAQGSPALVPLTIPGIGENNDRNVYMAFGDSITRGDGTAAGQDYPTVLHSMLGAHFAHAIVTNRGADATNSYEAIERVRRNLRGSNPSYTLVLYGTNDWNDPICKAMPPCYTVDNLREVVLSIKDWDSLVFVGTLAPVNPALNAPDRNEWIDTVNPLIEQMAVEEGAFVVDVNQAFKDRGDLASLFSDHVHPNAAGYRVIAEAFFEAIAHGRRTPSAARVGR